MARWQMKINGCHDCSIRVGCEEKQNPCNIYKKEPKKQKPIGEKKYGS